MEAMTVLDKVTEAIGRVLKGAGKLTKREAMTPENLLAYAIGQIEKAAKEPPAHAERRLRALGRTVETAKQAFVDTESETIEVEVFEEETTAAADETEKEISPVAAEPALGSSAFAENADDLNKVLARLGKELETFRDAKPKIPAADGQVQKADDLAWPFDMNTPEFRDGVKKAAGAPEWGEDPKGLRAKEA